MFLYPYRSDDLGSQVYQKNAAFENSIARALAKREKKMFLEKDGREIILKVCKKNLLEKLALWSDSVIADNISISS